MRCLAFILIFNCITCSLSKQIFGSIGSKNPIQLAIANFLSRNTKPSPTCIKVASKIQSTNQTTGEKNTITCKFDYGTISNLCTYEKPISESNIEVTQKRTYYKSVEDFVKQKEIFAKNFQTFEIYNEDKTKKKQFYYDNDKRVRILEPDGGESIYTEFDSKNRPTKGKSNSHCEVPIEFSYDEQNYSLNVNISFSQTGPESNNYCVFYRSLIQNQNYKLEFDKDFFKLKDTITVGNTVTIINYSNLETEQVCTGNSGTVFTENLEPAEVTSIETENTLPGAAAGEFIILRGKNFNPNFASNQVQFHDKISVIPVSGDSTFVRVQIPQNARSGRILIDNGKAKSYSPNFIVYKYYLFIANVGPGELLVYNMNAGDGTLSSVQTLTGIPSIRSFAVTPDGKNIYISKDAASANRIERRRIELQVEETPPPPRVISKVSTTSLEDFGDNGSPKYIAVDPKGEYLFVNYITTLNQNQMNRISLNGTVSFVANSPGSYITFRDFTIHPSKKIYYISSNTTGRIKTINFDNNNLTEIQDTDPSATPNYAAIHPNGNFFYQATGGSQIARYNILPDGTLTSKSVYDSGSHVGIAIDNQGKFLVSFDSTSGGRLKSFNIQSDFSLSSISIAPITNAEKIVFDPSGRFVYSFRTDTPYSLYSYAVNQTNGALTAVTNSVTLSTPQNILFAKIPQ